MQIISKNEDERDGSGRADTVDIIIYTGRDSRYLEREHFERFRSRRSGI